MQAPLPLYGDPHSATFTHSLAVCDPGGITWGPFGGD